MRAISVVLRTIKTKVAILFALVSLTYIVAYLKFQGYEFSKFLGAFLISYSIFQANPTRLALTRFQYETGFNIKLVARIGLSFTVFVEYLSIQYAFSLFNDMFWWGPSLLASTMLLRIALFLFILALLLFNQEFFTRWTHLDMLGENRKKRFSEVTGITLVLCWFLAVGGGDMINFIVVPVFVVWQSAGDVLKRKKQLREQLGKRLGKLRLTANVLRKSRLPGKSFLLTFLKSARDPEIMWQAFIILPCATFLALSVRFYSVGDPVESSALAVWTLPVVAAYFGIRNSWRRPKSYLPTAMLLLAISITEIFPFSVPWIKYGFSGYEREVAIGLVNLFFFIPAAYFLTLSHFLMRRGRSLRCISRAKMFWRIGEASLAIPISILYLIRGFMIGELELTSMIALWFASFVLVLFEFSLHDEVKKFKNKLLEKKESSRIPERMSVTSSKRLLVLESYLRQILVPLLVLISILLLQ